MSIVKKITSTIAMMFIGGAMLFAQTGEKQESVTNEELKQFATAFQQVQVVNQSAQKEMVDVVESKGLTVEEYNALSQAVQNPDQATDASKEKMEAFEQTSQGISEIQVVAQEKMQEEILNTGLTIERYQEIAAKLQTDQELQQKIQEYMQGSQDNG